MSDRFDLERFVKAQEGVYAEVVAELRRGYKESHWMWFIFPQLKGLGRSWMAEKFGIGSREEAEAYLAHAVLGPRLVECTELVNRVEGRGIESIFGPVDAMKFRSSMTLFGAVAKDARVFEEAVRKYFGGRGDEWTLGRV